MRKYIILFFSVLPLLFACNSQPAGIIDQNEMALVLTDVHLADGTLMNVSSAPDTVYKYGMGKYLVVFKKYHTDTAQFRRSYKYYTLHPDELVSIYDKVLANLAVKNDSITALLAKQNTAAGKKPFLPTASPGKYMQKSGAIPHAQMSTNAAFEKQRAHRDSILRKNPKYKNAHIE